MQQGRIPAQTTASPLTGGIEYSLSRPKQTNDDSMHQTAQSQQFVCGNRCNHSKNATRFYVKPQDQDRRFHVIEEGLRRIPIALGSPHDYPMFHGLMFHEKKNDKVRSHRSERVEAELALLIPAIMDTVNLARMQLGYYTPGGEFVFFNYKTLVERTGMSYWRVERNMRHLQKYGLVSVKEIPKMTDDGLRADLVIISVSERIFEMLHLDDKEHPEQSAFLADRVKALGKDKKMIERSQRYSRFYDAFRPAPIGQEKIKKQTLEKDLEKGIDSMNKNIVNRNIPHSDEYARKREITAANELIKQFPHLSPTEAIKLVREHKKHPQ